MIPLHEKILAWESQSNTTVQVNDPKQSTAPLSVIEILVQPIAITIYLLCMELEGPWCMEGPPSFLFMPGGGHIPDPTWAGIPPMLGPIPGP